ncbi:hypothetical protein L226DRAFT_608919 [Lentinus tigrinus ALCF2SS1-7]|uniref:uncharacterized protein n=1 Tax=Lentinus tigrinus ALCF2SS1-7 TaxID=1328758 RepID=UPI001165E74F|nr:hypothetical protein L226DRAFT_608919 [Lentinus tigrinus ALCF2SS1-7]
MPLDGILTAPPPAYTPAYADSGKESYSRLTQSYSSIWNDCGDRPIEDRVSCFVSDVSNYQDPEDYTTLREPGLPFLVTIQSFLASASASSDASTSLSNSPTPAASVNPSSSPTDTVLMASATATPSSSPKQSSPSSSSSGSSHTGAIVGGVIGGVVFLLLAVAAFLFYRRRTARNARAPSAEFMHMARGDSSSPILSAKHAEGVLTPPSTSHGGDRIPLARQSSIESDDLPPAFTPGSFKDPVYEKVQASAALREEYEARDVEGGYKD